MIYPSSLGFYFRSFIDQDLTYKLFMLLSLTTNSCSSALHNLDLRYVVKSNKCVQFNLAKHHKRWREGTPRPLLTTAGFIGYPRFCFGKYLKCQKAGTHLLSGFHKQYNFSSTMSDWIESVLNSSKIDTSVYKAHSLHSSVTSNPVVSDFLWDIYLREFHGQLTVLGKIFIIKRLFHQLKSLKNQY